MASPFEGINAPTVPSPPPSHSAPSLSFPFPPLPFPYLPIPYTLVGCGSYSRKHPYLPKVGLFKPPRDWEGRDRDGLFKPLRDWKGREMRKGKGRTI